MGLQDRDYMRERRINGNQEEDLKRAIKKSENDFKKEVELNLGLILKSIVNATALLIVIFESIKLIKS